MSKKISRVELCVWYQSPIHCPFCGVKVLDAYNEENDGPFLEACKHTLFVAHDEGFEYRSPAFDENLGFDGLDNDSILSKGSPDKITDLITIPDAVKFAAYVGPPSFFGSYVGFDPGADSD